MVSKLDLTALADITEVPASTIEELARLIGTVQPLTIVPGFGMQRYTNSGQTMRALLALIALTGQIGKPGAAGCTRTPDGALLDDQGAGRPLPPTSPDGIIRVSISRTRLGQHMLATDDPPLRVAWVERGNPIPQNPETPKVIEAFRRLDFPRGRRRVPHRHRARGRRRAAREEHVRADRRDRGVLAPIHPDPAESDGAAGRGAAGDRDLPDAGPPAGHSGAGPRGALPGPSDADIEAWLEGCSRRSVCLSPGCAEGAGDRAGC